jgi:pimeloyl-ACP methyl ester carboxylesterase
MHKLLIIPFVFFTFLSTGQIDGTWHTSFVVMGTSNRMTMTISNYPEKPKVIIINPDSESQKENKMDAVKMTDSTLSFSWSAIALTFKGQYFSQGDSLAGTMNQSGIEWPVRFFREEQASIIVSRPQEPQEPFNYTVIDTLIQNGKIVLGATLVLPNNISGNYPIVVLASGSGAQDRNCELLGHKPFWVIADYLAENGIASLRFDDRGVGKSTGVFQMATLEDFASDVLACVEFLKSDSRFANHPIGLAGHSEGGMHVMMAASKNKTVEFLIELASVGTTGKEVLVEQQYLIPKKGGQSEEYAQWNRSLFEEMTTLMLETKKKNRAEKLTAYLNEKYKSAPEEYKKLTNEMNFKLGMQMFMNSEWMIQFLNYRTEDYLPKLSIPVLAINGSEDIQVPAESNQKGFEKNFSDKSIPNSKALISTGKNHLFQTCIECTVKEYGDIEETFSEEVLIEISTWIKSLKLY